MALELSDSDAQKPVREVAAELAPGTEYFLEVEIGRKVIEGWQFNHNGAPPTLEQALDCIIYYAENDAYPDQFHGER